MIIQTTCVYNIRHTIESVILTGEIQGLMSEIRGVVRTLVKINPLNLKDLAGEKHTGTRRPCQVGASDTNTKFLREGSTRNSNEKW